MSHRSAPMRAPVTGSAICGDTIPYVASAYALRATADGSLIRTAGFGLSADDDFADLDDRGLVGIVGDICHDLGGMRPKAGLEGFDRIAENVTHADIGRGSAGGCTGHALVDRVGLTGITHAGFYERHMLVAVVIVVEACAGCVGIHYAYLDHRCVL